MSEENGKVCCTCRHNKDNTCEIDDHYIGYNECFEHWCNRWARDKKEVGDKE